MILYRVNSKGISAFSVKKETDHGWTGHDNSRFRRSVLREREIGYILIRETYYTTDIQEAKKWHKAIQFEISISIREAERSLSRLDIWEKKEGMNEDLLPESHF